MSRYCMATRQSDGSFGCLACKRRWDADEEVQCEAEYEFVEGVPPTHVGVDLGKPDGDMTALSWPVKHPPTFMEFAAAAGYELQPYHRRLLEMIDEVLGGRTKRR